MEIRFNISRVAVAAILSIGLATVSSCSSECKNDNNTEVMNDNAVYENILTRSSVRSYTDEAVPDSLVNKMLRAGMAAPTARDNRPWEFFVVTNPDIKNKVAETSKNAGMAAKAPLLIVVCGNMDKEPEGVGGEYWIQDCSAATENILLAAHSFGLGAVWCGVYPIQERVESVREILDIPVNMIPLNVICIGYPDGETSPKDKWNPECVRYIR